MRSDSTTWCWTLSNVSFCSQVPFLMWRSFSSHCPLRLVVLVFARLAMLLSGLLLLRICCGGGYPGAVPVERRRALLFDEKTRAPFATEVDLCLHQLIDAGVLTGLDGPIPDSFVDFWRPGGGVLALPR